MLKLRLRQTRRAILLRITIVGLLLFPMWLFVLAWSFFKTLQWRNVRICREFIKRHHLAFEDIDASTLAVQQISGGLNNLNAIWSLRDLEGKPVRYCVKVFLPLGSLWAKVNALASPFPYVHDGKITERFTVDLISRAQLAERGLYVPRLIAFGARENLMVTEYLDGVVVDDVLKRIEEKGSFSDEDRTVIRECGKGLAQIHREGFSLIDTQPVNCIWVPSRGQVYFIDMEFCTRADYRVWDAAFFLISVVIRLPEPCVQEARTIFIEGYRSVRNIDSHDLDRLDHKLKQYIPVFLTILDMRQFSPGGLWREMLK